MRSRTVRRRKHKQLQRLASVRRCQWRPVANELLTNWQREARRRAKWLGAAPVWQLARDPNTQAAAEILDPTGGLLGDLRHICAEAIAEVVDRRMVQTGRPLSERRR